MNTGWYAGFGQLEAGVSDLVPFGDDGSRFSGATTDPSAIYRMRAVLRWLVDEGVTPAAISEHVIGLQQQFLDADVSPGRLLPPSGVERGNFLTFENEAAPEFYQALHDQKVITDYRGDRLRIGFGIYQDADDVDRLVKTLGASL